MVCGMSGTRHAALHVLLVACVSSIGCASLTTSKPADKPSSRAEHREPNHTAFERKHVEAQMAAARERLDQNDPAAAEKLLLALLERNSQLAEARLLLADVYVAQDRTAEAEEHLRTVLKQEPENARAHHALGLLCDVTGRTAEAAQHFRRAAELSPQNETFRLSLEAAAP
jgi:Flp pilus assembly protein TadD